ncbi:MAG TPA: SDR family NAD(P)-dependent oxidoreductase [Chloroflexota bacterium]|jgi:3-oxoacyl-[acyl-carrier protein] reductase|nr:SDR family NAD(P)-dependent oxidoreductase [Chloroflexota bacterium]
MGLSERVAVVTGGARGFGAAIGRELAGGGARVVVADLDVEAAEATASELRRLGPAAVAVRTDVSVVADARDLIVRTLERFGRLDVLINNAGICPLATIEEVTEELFDRVVAVNLKGVFFVSQAAVPVFKEQRSGKIVNVASVGGKTGGMMPVAPYSATKAGVISLTKSFASYLAPYGVAVNAVAPGPATTDLTRDWPADRMAALAQAIPFKRLARPEEIAAVVGFLASERCTYMTGEIVDVNGGLLMD